MDATIHCPHCEQEIAAAEPTCPACGHIHSGDMMCLRHPDRSADGVCVVCGDAVCGECDTEQTVHHTCPTHAEVQVIEGWAQVYTTSDTMEADLIRENLQSEGVDAAVLSQKDRMFNVDMGDLSPVRILVPAYAYLDACSVLSRHMDGKGEVLFACPGCGEAYDESDPVCRTCGAPLPTSAG